MKFLLSNRRLRIRKSTPGRNMEAGNSDYNWVVVAAALRAETRGEPAEVCTPTGSSAGKSSLFAKTHNSCVLH